MIDMERALQVYGTKAALARKLNVKPPALTQWGDRVPLLHQYRLKYKLAVEEFSNDEVGEFGS